MELFLCAAQLSLHPRDGVVNIQQLVLEAEVGRGLGSCARGSRGGVAGVEGAAAGDVVGADAGVAGLAQLLQLLNQTCKRCLTMLYKASRKCRNTF